MAIMDWDRAYSNRGAVPEFEDEIANWWAASVAVRTEDRCELDLVYGPTERERYDLFLPEAATPQGLVVYIHGGYWMAFDKGYSSQCARGPSERGFAVAIPNYDLCPSVKITDIANQIAACVAAAAERIAGPIVLAGHSAGGHLAALLACEEGPLHARLRERLVRTVPLSGVFDLRPLMMTEMNDTLQIDGRESRLASPALLTPLPQVDHVLFCGGDELPEFLRQSALLANIWTGLGVDATCRELGGLNHFTIPNELSDPLSEITRACVLD